MSVPEGSSVMKPVSQESVNAGITSKAEKNKRKRQKRKNNKKAKETFAIPDSARPDYGILSSSQREALITDEVKHQENRRKLQNKLRSMRMSRHTDATKRTILGDVKKPSDRQRRAILDSLNTLGTRETLAQMGMADANGHVDDNLVRILDEARRTGNTEAAFAKVMQLQASKSQERPSSAAGPSGTEEIGDSVNEINQAQERNMPVDATASAAVPFF